ncbi:hypothetical protein AALC16_05345 [Lachnospiraceae bacterium 29-91]|nr:hypothetical protein [uncultured Schaedlerella sp.]
MTQANVKDMGVNIPGFLEPLVRNIKSQVEEMGEQQERNVEKKHREGE